MKNVFLLLFCAACFSSCKEDWSDEYKDQYRESCMEEARHWAGSEADAKAYCECALNTTMKHYTTIDEVVENKDSAQLAKELDQCRENAMKSK
ncbi:hypothetical protein ACTHGU_22160 [Chitinophagaceae bacterium MMS25-I14]